LGVVTDPVQKAATGLGDFLRDGLGSAFFRVPDATFGDAFRVAVLVEYCLDGFFHECDVGGAVLDVALSLGINVCENEKGKKKQWACE
jgi:hypothetical protein